MNKNIVDIRVRYSDTDHFGVVYYARYLDWLEAGRTEILRDNGINYAELEERDMFAPVVHLEVDYKSAPKYDDIVEIETKMEKVGNSSVTFSYEIRNKQSKQVHATATTVNVFINRKKETVKVPDEVRKILD